MQIHKKYHADSQNFKILKYSISNESNDILPHDVYDPDLNFFIKNVMDFDKA